MQLSKRVNLISFWYYMRGACVEISTIVCFWAHLFKVNPANESPGIHMVSQTVSDDGNSLRDWDAIGSR